MIEDKNNENLKNLVMKYRYPNGIKGVQVSYKMIFKNMKEDNTLPENWKYPSTLAKFFQRHNLISEKQSTDQILSIIRPMLYKVEIDIRARFHVFWLRLKEHERSEFIKTIISILRFNGIEKENTYSYLVKNFEANGFLDSNTITKYIRYDLDSIDIQRKANNEIITKTENAIYEKREIMKSVFDELGFYTKYEFENHWDNLKTHDEKVKFISLICHEVLKKGVSATDVCSVISTGCQGLDYLNENYVRLYCPQLFKNQERVERKLGKTFIKSRSDTKETTKND